MTDTKPAPKRRGPSKKKERERRVKAVLEKFETLDLTIAEAMIQVVQDGAASPSVRVQASQVLLQTREKLTGMQEKALEDQTEIERAKVKEAFRRLCRGEIRVVVGANGHA